MTSKHHLFNWLGMLGIALIFMLIYTNGLTGLPYSNFTYILGVIVSIAGLLLIPAIIIVLLGFIPALFKKPRWAIFYKIAWVVLILFGIILVAGKALVG